MTDRQTTEEHHPEQPTTDRNTPDVPYACIRTGGGDYVIYEQQKPTAWIQSDTTTPVAECT